jgi:hypothetical protein
MGLRQNTAQPYDEFEAMRRRAKQAQQSQTQESQQKLERNFARFGGLNTGAYAKQTQLLDEASNRQAADVEEQIRGAEMQERKRKDEILQNKEFQSGEAQKQRDFVSAQEKLGRDFQREISDKDFSFRDKVFNAENSSRLKQMEIQQQQFDKSYALEKDAQEFNKMMARIEADKPTDLLGSLLGPAFSMGGKNSFFSPLNNIVGGVGGKIGSVFCFVAGTIVKMQDGTSKKIEEIEIGDECEIGGKVYSKGCGLSSYIFNFHNVLVTGFHAFYDEQDKKWKRVHDYLDTFHIQGQEDLVYFISNKYHRMNVNGIVFADFDETDEGSRLSTDESLRVLNKESLSWPILDAPKISKIVG